MATYVNNLTGKKRYTGGDQRRKEQEEERNIRKRKEREVVKPPVNPQLDPNTAVYAEGGKTVQHKGQVFTAEEYKDYVAMKTEKGRTYSQPALAIQEQKKQAAMAQAAKEALPAEAAKTGAEAPAEAPAAAQPTFLEQVQQRQPRAFTPTEKVVLGTAAGIAAGALAPVIVGAAGVTAVGIKGITLSAAIGKSIIAVRQDVTNAKKDYTLARDRLEGTITAANTKMFPPQELDEEFNNELQALYVARDNMKALTDGSLNKFLSGGADDLAEITDTIENLDNPNGLRTRYAIARAGLI